MADSSEQVKVVKLRAWVHARRGAWEYGRCGWVRCGAECAACGVWKPGRRRYVHILYFSTCTTPAGGMMIYGRYPQNAQHLGRFLRSAEA